MKGYRHLAEYLRELPGNALVCILVFAVMAGLWIALSDAAIVALTGHTGRLAVFLIFKGAALALITTMTLLVFLKRARLRQEIFQKELFLAQHDPSTNLFRRPEWIRRVDSILNREQVLHEPAVVATVIVNRYDYLVHRFGFENMHQLLGVFGRRLRVLVHTHDMVGTANPAVFVVYMHGVATRKQAMDVVERILDSGKRTFLVNDEPVTLNLNIGLSSYPDDGVNAEDLLARANIAMEQAVSAGLNRSCWYSAEMAEKVVTRVSLEKDLEKALDRQQLIMYFQPRIALATGLICGCEALLRWQHPKRGLIPPSEFIEVAEDSGLIVEIGRWALVQSMNFIRKWLQAGLSPITVSVNVSNAQLNESNFIQDLDRMLSANRSYAQLIELEITESLAMKDPQSTMRMLHEAKEAGMRVSLDDFGTGYSSLSYLQRFPIDCLKIDRSFIVDMIENRNCRELTRTLISLGHSLGTCVLAEGVETLAQVRMLKEYNCDEVQGYFFSRPVPADRMMSLVSDFQPPRLTREIAGSATITGRTYDRGIAHAARY